ERRMLYDERQLVDDPLAQVGMQARLQLADELLRRTDQQPVDALALVGLEREVGRVAAVVLLLLLDPPLVARLRPAALLVLRVDEVFEALGLLEAVAGAGEEARDAPVGEQHHPALRRA